MSASVTPYIKFLILVLLGGMATITFASFVLGLGGQGLPSGAPEVQAMQSLIALAKTRGRSVKEPGLGAELSGEGRLTELLEVFL